MEPQRDIVFITFDIAKSDYPSMPYSIASLIASIQKHGFVSSHYSVDVKQILADTLKSTNYKDSRMLTYKEQEELQKQNHDVATIVENRLLSTLDYMKTFRFVAMSVTRWSIEYCNTFAKHLKEQKYQGKIVFGGYEITACNDSELSSEFPNADYYSKGYAEVTYIELLKGSVKGERILKGKVEPKDLVSPYLDSVINTHSRKIYWETKRGCMFKCDFCEWGALNKEEKDNVKTVEIDKKRLFREIDMFAKTGIEELNILDGTFNVGKNYLTILKYVMENSNLKVVLQARYELINKDFLDLCEKYRERIHLEFGLQTIHDKEMETIGRKNNINKIEANLKEIVKRNLSFETSIIYAIPGQTMESYIDTIEFLIINGCKTIRAFPLELARNSKLSSKENRSKWKIFTQTDPETKYCTVVSSASFTNETRKDMDRLSKRLFSDKRLFDGKPKDGGIIWEKDPKTLYQRRFKSLGTGYDAQYLYYLIDEYFDKPNLENAFQIDFSYCAMQLGEIFQESCKKVPNYIENHIQNALTSNYYKEIPNRSKENTDIVLGNGNILNMRKSQANYKSYCVLRAGKSGNLYVYSGIVKDDH